MKFGINCTFTDRSTITPAAYGRAVEDRGFDSIFLAEHTHIPVKEISPYPFGDRPASLYHTIDPFVASTSGPRLTRSIWSFWSAKRSLVWFSRRTWSKS